MTPRLSYFARFTGKDSAVDMSSEIQDVSFLFQGQEKEADNVVTLQCCLS